MQVPKNELDAAVAEARRAIEEYSAFDSAMVPDSALEMVVNRALIAAAKVRGEVK